MVSALVITIINAALRTVIQRLSLYEKHDTLTNHRVSVASKLLFARFTNTAIVPILVSRSFSDWQREGGLVGDIFYLMLSLAFVDPIMYLINANNLIKRFKRFLERRKGANSQLTQAQANELFEGPRVDMANLLSNTANMLLTAIFYAPLIPITIPIALVGMCFSYWVDKFNLFRIHRVPEMINGVLPIFFANLLPYFALLWSLSYFFIFGELIT